MGQFRSDNFRANPNLIKLTRLTGVPLLMKIHPSHSNRNLNKKEDKDQHLFLTKKKKINTY